MFTLVIGGVTLAVPIAAASIGAIPSIILIIFFCAVSMVTIGGMAESVTRSGGIRYGNAFIGRVVGDFLGSGSSALLTAVLTVFSFGLLLIFYIGISSTLEGSTGLPAELWLFVLFGIGLYFLSRGSLNVTVAFTFLFTIVNTILLLIIGLLALSKLNISYLTYTNIPLLNGQPFDPTLYGSIIGVIMGLFSAHMMVAVFGKMILERDPSGKALVRGHPAGILAAGIINIFWVIAVNGAVPPAELVSETGTSLVPLTAELGRLVGVLGAIFVVLSMGMGLIHFSIALFNLAGERLSPQRSKSLGRVGTFLVSLSPVILVFAIALWLSITGSGSFAGILGFLGILVDSLMIGIFPMILLLASRRKGELVPGVMYRFLGNRLLVIAIFLLYLFILFFHGLVIWQSPLAKAAGIIVGLLVIVLTIDMLRKKRFAPRMVAELRDDHREGHQSLLALVDSGETTDADLILTYKDGRELAAKTNTALNDFSRLQSLALQLPQSKSRELKVWVHQITPEGDIGTLPALSVLSSESQQEEIELSAAHDQKIMPLDNEPAKLETTLQKKVKSAAPCSLFGDANMSPEKKKTNQHDANGNSGSVNTPEAHEDPEITIAKLQTALAETKAANQRLDLAAHALRDITESVSITDMEDIVLFVNEAFCRTYGFQEEELLGKPIDIIRSPNNPPEVGQAILPATLQGGWQGEILNLRKDGSEFSVALSTSVVRTDEGQPMALIGVATDITMRKKEEETLRKQNAYLAALHSTTLGLTSRLDLKDLLRTLLCRAAELLDTAHGFLYLVEPFDYDESGTREVCLKRQVG